MSIRLLDYRAIQVIFRPNSNLIDYLNEIQDRTIDLPAIAYHAIFPEGQNSEFLIHFDFDLNIKDEMSKDSEDLGILKFDFIARFASDVEITQQFKESHFPSVNAPAIAYPFLRAFVNNFFINSGYNPVLLPTYNFTKSVQERDQTNSD
ncbi:protein-export chaperone SecB [Acinetobacter guillouiae]|uniref:protein-export chaperone SecB n=1 Tax=Acinetobacter guillouiae TaxID=106649 RepID=UPI001CD80EB6|nr:protein-export chaperone SecB [Acinetobacter guillouiae]